jgi:hypothetical protein
VTRIRTTHTGSLPRPDALAEAIMALEALDQSGAWQAYWDCCLQQAA